MELIRLNERIWYATWEEETDRPVLGYIKGERYVLAVDAGNSKAHVQTFYELLQLEGLKLPDYTVITHWHWDHTFGMHAVNGLTIAGHKTNEKLKQVMNWEWTEEAMKERLKGGEDIVFCDECIRKEYPSREEIRVKNADIIFKERLSLDLGGITCELITTEAPHSRDSVLIYIPELKVLFTGDADAEDHYENQGLYDKKLLGNYIQYLKTIDFDTCIIGHSPVETKTSELAYLEEELAKL